MRRFIASTLLALLPLAASAQGLPGLRGVDHIGITVPRLGDAVNFFVDVLGCSPFYSLGPFRASDDWMQTHLNVDPRAEITELRLVRCGNGANLEVFEYRADGASTRPPLNSDAGGHHIAFYVEDMAKAVAYLRAKGVRVLGAPTTMTSGPSAGETWVYFLAPWGLQLELVSYPAGKAYERTTKDNLWDPNKPNK